MVQSINSSGWAMFLFIIIVGQNYFEDWYCNNLSLFDWVIRTSENGWIINELSFKWIKHFDQYSKNCIIDMKCLLVLNSYNSYYLYEFECYYKENNIVIFCMFFYLFQLFDIGCFNILKQSYNKEIENFIQFYINYIIKFDFFVCFYIIFFIIFGEENI